VAAERSRTRRAYVGLGANVGDAAGTLRAAAARLRELGAVTALSPVYRTKPVGYLEQPDFLNAVAGLATALSPERLLSGLHALEDEFGRVREVRLGPRTLDLDLIWYEGVVRTRGRPLLPHPRAHEREFVLRPLCDLAPDLELHGRPASAWLAALEPQGVEPAGIVLA
jgi:2-amino-4-hydroxy-6-hydroxymethyldihydropteridine diphosphokinase